MGHKSLQELMPIYSPSTIFHHLFLPSTFKCQVFWVLALHVCKAIHISTSACGSLGMEPFSSAFAWFTPNILKSSYLDSSGCNLYDYFLSIL